MTAVSMAKTGNTYYPNMIEGTVAAILFHAQHDNELTVRALVETATQQFKEKTGEEPTGQFAFCQMVIEKNRIGTLAIRDILDSEFFQSMKALESFHEQDQIRTLVAPKMIQAARRHFASAVVSPWEERPLLSWYAAFAKRILSKKEIDAYGESKEREKGELTEERQAIVKDVFDTAVEGQLEQTGFKFIIDMCSHSAKWVKALKEKEGTEAPFRLAARYLTWIGKSPNPTESAEDVAEKLRVSLNRIFE